MKKQISTRNEISSIEVVEPLPQLLITLPRTDAGAPTILVDGMPAAVAMEIPWGPIIDKLAELIFGDGGGGGSGGGCTTIKITNPDGSSTEIKQCPPSKS